MPLVFGATSRVILAHLRLPQLRQIYELQAREFSRTGGDKTFEDLQQSLRQIRKQGYCSSRGEVTQGLIGIAAPVFDSENTVIGSLTMTVAEAGTNERRLRPIIDRVVFSANVLTNSLRQRN
jgi:DNA-binding IclR family transcriptional regulator